MSTYLRVISINPSGNGGKASGAWYKDGVLFNGTPNLARGDVLQAQVQTTGGGNAPASLNGYMIIGPAPVVAETQNDASPFLNGNKQVCCMPYSNVQGNNGLYTFTPGFTMGTPANGLLQFELTFVAVDPTSQKQWEEDPEFDTGT